MRVLDSEWTIVENGIVDPKKPWERGSAYTPLPSFQALLFNQQEWPATSATLSRRRPRTLRSTGSRTGTCPLWTPRANQGPPPPAHCGWVRVRTQRTRPLVHAHCGPRRAALPNPHRAPRTRGSGAGGSAGSRDGGARGPRGGGSGVACGPSRGRRGTRPRHRR